MAVAKLIQALPAGTKRSADLRRSLNLDAALAWQIHTLARGEDALTSARVVPKAGAMERFLAAARGQGLPSSMTEEAREAYVAFERLVADHAGDRETFDAMVSGLRPEDAAGLLRIRRAAYKANAAVWGLTVRCTLNAVVFHERPTGEHDCMSVRARVGVQRLQERAAIGIYASGRTWGGSTYPPEGAPRVAVDECQLLEEFCSAPMPRVERVATPDGGARDYLKLEGLGKASEVTAYWRNLSLNFPGGSRTPPHGCTIPCLEPTEMTVADLLIPRGWADPRTASLHVTPANTPVGPGPGGLQQLPCEVKVSHLGNSLDSLYTVHSPRYVEVMERGIKELGWAATEFDIFRCVVPYPVMHAAVHIKVG